VEVQVIDFKSYASSSAGNLYTVSDGQTRIMLECGLSWAKIQKALNFEASSYAGALLTHFHKDHSAGVKDVVAHGIDLWASKETIEACGITGHRVWVAEPLKPFQVGTWQVIGVDVSHDSEGCLAWLMSNKAGESLLFATDLAYMTYRFPKLSVLAIEANFDEDLIRENVASGEVDRFVKRRTYGTHLSIQRVLDFLKANDLSQLREVHLLHLSNANSDAEAFKRKVQEITGVPVFVH
jgi:phosphoribosyl 1,2-cyclic phosphodiesterase